VGRTTLLLGSITTMLNNRLGVLVGTGLILDNSLILSAKKNKIIIKFKNHKTATDETNFADKSGL
jgi:hypothetical protein